MNSCILSVLVLLVALPQIQSLCTTKRTDWGSLGAVFTDPLCDVWCHMRFCGKGHCREKLTTRNQAECICEKCVGYGSRYDTDYSGSSPDRYGNRDYYYPRQAFPRSDAYAGTDNVINYNPNV